MRIRMKTLYAGPDGVFHPKQEPDLPANEAMALMAGGYADAVDVPVVASPNVYETAVAPEYEQSVIPRRKRKSK